MNQNSFVVCYNLLTRGSTVQPSWSMTTLSSVTALAFHPRRTNFLTVGMANGVIAMYDITKDSEKSMVFRSDIGEFFHLDRVTSLQWIKYKVNNNMEQLLISGSLDGKVLFWGASDKFKYPKRGFVLANNKRTYTKSHFSGILDSSFSQQHQAK